LTRRSVFLPMPRGMGKTRNTPKLTDWMWTASQNVITETDLNGEALRLVERDRRICTMNKDVFSQVCVAHNDTAGLILVVKTRKAPRLCPSQGLIGIPDGCLMARRPDALIWLGSRNQTLPAGLLPFLYANVHPLPSELPHRFLCLYSNLVFKKPLIWPAGPPPLSLEPLEQRQSEKSSTSRGARRRRG
jgi:hypothetical protein